MEEQNSKSKTHTILILVGSILLAGMALFHGSGLFYITDLINKSNTNEFLKEIFPVLFAHPSIHLIGLSVFGIVTLYLNQDAKKILYLLTALVLIDSILAFTVGGIFPGLLLSIPVLCFAFAALKIKAKSSQ